MDPDTEVDVSYDEKSYSWSGKRTGKGHMEITREIKNQTIDYNLTFLKPWKSVAYVKFTTTTTSEGNPVTWQKNSSLPWFMFWMKKKMIAFIRNDFKRGLNLLNDYIEDGKAHSTLVWKGESHYPSCKYLDLKILIHKI